MATLAKPKHGDLSSYRSRNAYWRQAKCIDPDLHPYHSRKKPSTCKPSPDGEHAFAEWCVYCGRQQNERGSTKWLIRWRFNLTTLFVLCWVHKNEAGEVVNVETR